MIILGAVHNFRQYRERTKRTLFRDPLPPCRERTLKNVETNISFPSRARIAAWTYTQTKPIIKMERMDMFSVAILPKIPVLTSTFYIS